jgi:hypothetical protein
MLYLLTSSLWSSVFTFTTYAVHEYKVCSTCEHLYCESFTVSITCIANLSIVKYVPHALYVPQRMLDTD